MKNHKYIIWGFKGIFAILFGLSAYKKLKESLTIHKPEQKRSFKLMPEKGILGTVSHIVKDRKK